MRLVYVLVLVMLAWCSMDAPQPGQPAGKSCAEQSRARQGHNVYL
jgi:hypothetical protein